MTSASKEPLSDPAGDIAISSAWALRSRRRSRLWMQSVQKSSGETLSRRFNGRTIEIEPVNGAISFVAIRASVSVSVATLNPRDSDQSALAVILPNSRTKPGSTSSPETVAGFLRSSKAWPGR